eukprot:TRINITY_DN21172_c0_g1_i1.p1 TRINITY_DN21172_c0_g1~~TRINITY_DN21172_c0_g1_i1.p1  ORF type:complete len:483 (-),score=38.80 TRINITY_DN21172_c0_g1_i1:98-1489(-)
MVGSRIRTSSQVHFCVERPVRVTDGPVARGATRRCASLSRLVGVRARPAEAGYTATQPTPIAVTVTRPQAAMRRAALGATVRPRPNRSEPVSVSSARCHMQRPLVRHPVTSADVIVNARLAATSASPRRKRLSGPSCSPTPVVLPGLRDAIPQPPLTKDKLMDSASLSFLSKTKVMPVRFMSGAPSTSPTQRSDMRRNAKHVRILCYGDSLTVGFCANGAFFEPYGRTLATGLSAAGFSCEVLVCGHSGGTAAEMVTNLDHPAMEDVAGLRGKGLRRILDEDGSFDVVLIMAGTNDIGHGASPLSSLCNIQKLHAVCHSRGIKTVVLPPPASPSMRQLELATRRRELVGNLLMWASACPNIMAFVDPSDSVATVGWTQGLAWDSDGVHMSPAGSRLLGQSLVSMALPAFSNLFRWSKVEAPTVLQNERVVFQVEAPTVLQNERVVFQAVRPQATSWGEPIKCF